MKDYRELVHQIVAVCLDVREGENVWIHSWDHTIDLASEIAFACREKGAHPFISLTTEGYWMRSLLETPKKLLETLPTNQSAALEHTDVFIFMLGPRNPVDWNKISPEKRALTNIWYLESNKYLEEWRKIAKEQHVRILGIEYCLVTKERAQVLGLDYREWEEVMLAGCVSDQQKIAKKAFQRAEIIREGREVHIQTPFGTNFRFKLAACEPIMSDSIVTDEDAAKGIVKFLPSGCVEVAVDENSAEGTVVFDVPIPFRGGKKIRGLTLMFKHGKVVKHMAETGIEAFENYMKSSEGDVDKFGFFGFGLNPGLRHGFTQDDKVLGGVTIGIGGNEDKGGKNRTSGNNHWWASMTKASVKIDGKIILKNGAEFYLERE